MQPIRLELTPDRYDAFVTSWSGERRTLSPLRPFRPTSNSLNQVLAQASREIQSQGELVCHCCKSVIPRDSKFCPVCGKPTTNRPTCPSCGAAHSPDAQFCPSCGKPTATKPTCASCGAALSPNAQFCSACGKPRTPYPQQYDETPVPLEALLSGLAETDLSADLCLNRCGELKDISLYSSSKLNAATAYQSTAVMTDDSDKIILQSPFAKANLAMELQRLVETVRDPNNPVDITINQDDAIVLGVLLDLGRHAGLTPVSAKAGAAPALQAWSCKESKVLQAIKTEGQADASSWIFSTTFKAIISSSALDLARVRRALGNLAHCGLAQELVHGSYSLAERCQNLVGHFKNIDKAFWVSIQHAEDEESALVSGEELLGFCSDGVNLMFSLSPNGSLSMRTLTAEGVIDTLSERIWPSPGMQPAESRVPSIISEYTPKQKKRRSKLWLVSVAALLLACLLGSCGGLLLALENAMTR